MNHREKCKRIQEKESCNISVVRCDAGEEWGPLVGGAQEGAGAQGFPDSGRNSTRVRKEPSRGLSWPILSSHDGDQCRCWDWCSYPSREQCFALFNFYFTKMNIMDFLIVIGA